MQLQLASSFLTQYTSICCLLSWLCHRWQCPNTAGESPRFCTSSCEYSTRMYEAELLCFVWWSWNRRAFCVHFRVNAPAPYFCVAIWKKGFQKVGSVTRAKSRNAGELAGWPHLTYWRCLFKVTWGCHALLMFGISASSVNRALKKNSVHACCMNWVPRASTGEISFVWLSSN